MNSVMAAIPFPQATGFAITSLVQVFQSVLLNQVGGDTSRVFISYSDGVVDASGDAPHSDADGLRWALSTSSDIARIESAVRKQNVKLLVGLDFPVRQPIYGKLRAAGIESIVSYLGAPSSSENRGLRLLSRRIDVALARWAPEHFIFETEAMRSTGVRGRGIPIQSTSVVPLGVDTSIFRPHQDDKEYPYMALGIPTDRHLIFYSGHFEARKGVGVLIDALRVLVEKFGRKDVHLVLVGNRTGEEIPYRDMLLNSPADDHVTFGGYRDDIARLHRGCAMGVIASTGWDSMTMSSVEMQSSGLPLIVSDLQGLPETIEQGVTGEVFPVGDSHQLAATVHRLLQDPSKLALMRAAARTRAVALYDRTSQIQTLSAVVGQSWARRRGVWA